MFFRASSEQLRLTVGVVDVSPVEIGAEVFYVSVQLLVFIPEVVGTRGVFFRGLRDHGQGGFSGAEGPPERGEFFRDSVEVIIEG